VLSGERVYNKGLVRIEHSQRVLEIEGKLAAVPLYVFYNRNVEKEGFVHAVRGY
jgi:hypothetical protein